MTCSMDIPEEYDHPDFKNVCIDIIQRCSKAKVGVGIHMSQLTTPIEGYQEMIDAGMNWVPFGSDIGVLMYEMGRHLKGFRDKMGDVYEKTGGDGLNIASCLTGLIESDRK